ncbi:uncharacterized protein BO66DRAFT_181006 [Aspergillus aculeatinus CBS 121060]|uniref:Uncharacterized protein n=1 Tax=Aspergillus aculeatinus CBS 121060 TaxID=1448322 RepID=A0ACD1GYN6_9EURO|nr:hypothetical protein BO66DRAFT_181006 [Aspergillus aculeatinus CBS 121060]RAH66445.1 hypothetical protein BO66DRAFT_181006 [Aspergillus aculeatinus CBS 121060]
MLSELCGLSLRTHKPRTCRRTRNFKIRDNGRKAFSGLCPEDAGRLELPLTRPQAGWLGSSTLQRLGGSPHPLGFSIHGFLFTGDISAQWIYASIYCCGYGLEMLSRSALHSSLQRERLAWKNGLLYKMTWHRHLIELDYNINREKESKKRPLGEGKYILIDMMES